jgi:hypothetical protein
VAEPALISVRTQVVLDTLVGSMGDAVWARLEDPLEPHAEAAIASTGVDQRLARMGYLARAIEVERFERAREPMPWLADHLRHQRVDGTAWSDAAAAVASRLADAEPPERPEPGDERAVSWQVPGPGGHVRFYLAVRSAGASGGRLTLEAKRSWLTGFLVHCLIEAAPPDQP